MKQLPFMALFVMEAPPVSCFKFKFTTFCESIKTWKTALKGRSCLLLQHKLDRLRLLTGRPYFERGLQSKQYQHRALSLSNHWPCISLWSAVVHKKGRQVSVSCTPWPCSTPSTTPLTRRVTTPNSFCMAFSTGLGIGVTAFFWALNVWRDTTHRKASPLQKVP